MENEIGKDITEGLGSKIVDAPAPAPSPEPVAAPAAPAASAEPSAAAAQAAIPAASVTPAPLTPSTPATDDKSKPQDAIPLAVALDWRDDLKRAKAELAELKAKSAQPQQPAAPVPSFKDDPDGLAAYQANMMNRIATGARFDVSEMTAREKHGDEVVTAAMEWGTQRSTPSNNSESERIRAAAFAQEFLAQKNPIDWIVKQQKKASVLTDIGDDVDAYVRRRAAELGFTTAAAPAAASQPQANAPASQQPPASAASIAPQPTRSLASQPSAGGLATVPTGQMAAFDALDNGLRRP